MLENKKKNLMSIKKWNYIFHKKLFSSKKEIDSSNKASYNLCLYNSILYKKSNTYQNPN